MDAFALFDRIAAWDEELRGEKPPERPPLPPAAAVAPPLPAAVAPVAPSTAETEKCEHIDCNETFFTTRQRKYHQRFHQFCSEATRTKCTRCLKVTDPQVIKDGRCPPLPDEDVTEPQLPTSALDLLAKRAKGDIIKCPHRGCKQEFFGQKVGGLENHLRSKNIHFTNCSQPCTECEARGWIPRGDELRLPCDHVECTLHFVGEKERHHHIARHQPCSQPRHCQRCQEDERRRARLAARQASQQAAGGREFPTDPTAVIGDGSNQWEQQDDDDLSPDSSAAGGGGGGGGGGGEKGPKKKRGSYLCKACGQLKRGHICPAVIGVTEKKKKKQRTNEPIARHTGAVVTPHPYSDVNLPYEQL